MAANILRQHVLPLGGLAMGLALVPSRSVYAEEVATDPLRELRRKKSIYDSPSELSTREIAASTPPPASGITERPLKGDETAPLRSGPVRRLADQVRKTRLFLHGYAAQAEDAVNSGMDRFMSAEKDFTTTIASLAPPKESNEKLLPGSIYVLVATMAGSIVSRNRNILLRLITPVATGLVTAHYVVPRTMENVEQLVWSYEKKFPVLRDNHIRAQEGVRHFIETGKAHSQMGLAMAQDRVQGVRESMEQWLSKGR